MRGPHGTGVEQQGHRVHSHELRIVEVALHLYRQHRNDGYGYKRSADAAVLEVGFMCSCVCRHGRRSAHTKGQTQPGGSGRIGKTGGLTDNENGIGLKEVSPLYLS